MKDGTDGESYPFKLQVVDLGFDADGEPETSCVVVHLDQAPVEGGSKKVKLGPRQQMVYDLLKMMAPTGTVADEDLIEAYKTKTRKGEGRDQRRQHAVQALNELIARKLAFKHGEDRTSLTSLVTSGGEAEWLDQ